MSKMCYFNSKFSKIAKRRPINLRFWWPEVAWSAQIVVFQTKYDEIKHYKISYDVILVTSSLLHQQKRHQTNVTRFLGSTQSKFLATPVLISTVITYLNCLKMFASANNDDLKHLKCYTDCNLPKFQVDFAYFCTILPLNREPWVRSKPNKDFNSIGTSFILNKTFLNLWKFWLYFDLTILV